MADKGVFDRGGVRVHVASATSTQIVGTQVESTDTTGYRMKIDANGRLEWGQGVSYSTDVVLYRSTTNTLALGASDKILLSGAATSTQVVGTQVDGTDTDGYRMKIDANGRLEWGQGVTFATDVVLYRSTTNTLTLATGDTLELDYASMKVNGTKSAPSVILNDADTGLFLAAANTVGVSAGGAETVRVITTPASGACALYVMTMVGGTATLVQVTLNTVDSGGTGYRALVVPNANA